MNLDPRVVAQLLKNQEELHKLAVAKAEQELREATAKAEAAEVVKKICIKQLGMDEAQAAIQARKWVT
jgi:hypothetical protein